MEYISIWVGLFSLIISVIAIIITSKSNKKLRLQNWELSKLRESEFPVSFKIKNEDWKEFELVLDRYNDSNKEQWFTKIINQKGGEIGNKISFQTKLSAIEGLKTWKYWWKENQNKYFIIQ